MIKILEVQKLNGIEIAGGAIPNEWSREISLHNLSKMEWSPETSATVKFKVAHTGNFLLIKYIVEEDHVLATYTQDQSPVYKDSCVEFFFAGDDNQYFNLEFSCLGTCLAAYGPNRELRSPFDEIKLNQIIRQGSLGRSPLDISKRTSWELEIALPLGDWLGKPLSGNAITGNFYKCGDNLQSPHYLAWNPVRTKNPDFHRPDFFGELHFI